jgi:hypothetical protein
VTVVPFKQGSLETVKDACPHGHLHAPSDTNKLTKRMLRAAWTFKDRDNESERVISVYKCVRARSGSRSRMHCHAQRMSIRCTSTAATRSTQGFLATHLGLTRRLIRAAASRCSSSVAAAAACAHAASADGNALRTMAAATAASASGGDISAREGIILVNSVCVKNLVTGDKTGVSSLILNGSLPVTRYSPIAC